MLRSLTLLVYEHPLFFRLRLEFFTIFPFLHQAMEAGRILQSCIHLLSLLLHSFSSCFCLKSFVQHCSCFRQLVSLLVAFGNELSQVASSFLFPSLCGVPSRVPLPPGCLFSPVHVILPQFFIHTSASPALGLIPSFSPFRNPSIVPLLSTWTLMGPLS